MTQSPLDDRILQLFHEEAAELIQSINAGLLQLEAGDDLSGTVQAILRSAHSLKGAAAAAGLRTVERMSHAWESFVKAVENGQVELTKEGLDLLFGSLDAIDLEVQAGCLGVRPSVATPLPSGSALRAAFGSDLATAFDHTSTPPQGPLPSATRVSPVPTPASGDETPRPPEPEQETRTGPAAASPLPATPAASLRVATEKIDRLMASVEQLVRVKGQAAALRGMGNLTRRLFDLQHLVERGSSGTGVSAGVGRDLRAHVGQLLEDAVTLEMQARSHAHQLDQLADTLQDDIRSVRMVPVTTILTPFARMVRDAARRGGRLATLEISGANAELDRDLLEPLQQALGHLIRNAVVHGIEAPEERLQQSKQREGRIHLRFARRAGWLHVEVQDDGRGLDGSQIAAAALAIGVSEADLAAMDESAVRALVFRPGLTTSPRVSELAGRGVGLDAVRQAMEACGGIVSVDSTPGAGSTFHLRMPLSIATLRVLEVAVGGETFVIPVPSVERILRVSLEDLVDVDAGSAIELGGGAIPVLSLAEVVASPQLGGETNRYHAVVLSSGVERVAVLCDRVLGEQELVIKPLGTPLQNVGLTSGVAVSATGGIIPVLSVSELIRRGTGTRSAAKRPTHVAAETRPKRVLIVDDSITTRTLEKSILEAVGYEVVVATDGVHALDTLRHTAVDLVLSDVQMPRMDGIELVHRLKQNSDHRNTPIVLVSSLNSDDDRQRGLDAGADAYIGKQEFRQEVLMETIERLT